MEKQAQILDASVVVKWFVNEEDTNKAIILWKKHASNEIKIIIPNLTIIEVINSLRYKENDEETLTEVNKILWNSDLKIETINEQTINKAINIAKKYNLTIYDSIYVALAQFNGCQLITADKALFNIPNILPLKDI